MRPVNRGEWPKDADGKNIPFADYSDARDDLIRRIGDYCSYCEICLHGSIAVEHVRPKTPQPALEREWTNFLLACNYCNSIKLDHDVDLADYFWPDRDNTARVFDYVVNQPPQIMTSLDPALRPTAERTIALTGLDRVPGHRSFSDRDRRWLKRREAWGVAIDGAVNSGRTTPRKCEKRFFRTQFPGVSGRCGSRCSTTTRRCGRVSSSGSREPPPTASTAILDRSQGGVVSYEGSRTTMGNPRPDSPSG